MNDDLINKIHNENCLDTMSRMQDCFIDLGLGSCPYDGLRTYNGYSFDFENIAKGLYRVIKIGGVLVWVVGDSTRNGSESGTSFRQALYFMQCGFKLHDTMIYAKENFIPQSHNRYEQAFEYMFVFAKESVKTFNPIKVASTTAGVKINLSRKGYGFKEGSFRRRNETMVTNDLKVPGNIFYYPCGTSGKNHPAVFPDKLASDQIQTWTNEGDLVYDPFMGSGTTAEMAIKLHRDFIGSEISKDYVSMANKLIEPYLIQTNIFKSA